MKVAIFGDSITAGWTNNHVSFILKEKVMEQLTQHGVEETSVRLFGVPGDDCLQGMQRVKEVEDFQADLNFIFFGANDASLHKNVSEQVFQDTLTAMALRLGASRCIFLTPPYYNESCGDVRRSNERVEKYRIRTFLAAQSVGSDVVDVYQAMIQCSSPNDLLQSDGLHFSSLGYEMLAECIVKKILERIGEHDGK